MSPIATTGPVPPSASSWGDTLLNILNKGVDTAASYGAAKIQADAVRKATEAAYRSDMAGAKTAAAGSSSGTASGMSALPKWVLPLGLGVGALLVVGLVVKLFSKK